MVLQIKLHSLCQLLRSVIRWRVSARLEERTAFFFGDSEPIDCYRFDAVIFTGVIGIFTMDGIIWRGWGGDRGREKAASLRKSSFDTLVDRWWNKREKGGIIFFFISVKCKKKAQYLNYKYLAPCSNLTFFTILFKIIFTKGLDYYYYYYDA